MRSGPNLTHTLLEKLGQEIVAGVYDDRVLPTESVLAVRYGASRTILREAVKMLTAKGLLLSRTRAGTLIQPLSNWNLLDPQVLRWLARRDISASTCLQLCYVRLAFEPTAAGLAAGNASAEDLKALRNHLDQMMLAQADQKSGIEHEIAFHKRILLMSDNLFFQQLRPLIQTALQFSVSRSATPEDMSGLPDHLKVLLAIERGGAEITEKATRSLIRRNLEALRAIDLSSKAPVDVQRRAGSGN